MIILQSLTVAYVGEAEKKNIFKSTNRWVCCTFILCAINNSHLHIFASGAYTYLQNHNKHRCSKLRTAGKFVKSANDERRVEKLFYDIWWHINHRSNQCNFHSLLLLPHTTLLVPFHGWFDVQNFNQSEHPPVTWIRAWTTSGESWKKDKRPTDDIKLQKKWRKACIPNKISQELNGIKLLMLAHSRMSKLLFASVAEKKRSGEKCGEISSARRDGNTLCKHQEKAWIYAHILCIWFNVNSFCWCWIRLSFCPARIHA